MQTFNVNTNNDIVDPNDNLLSLREAVTVAEQIPGEDTINLSSIIEIESPLLINAGNDLDINGNGQFSGVDGNNQTQLFDIRSGANIRFENLTLTEGFVQGSNGSRGGGGGAGFGGANVLTGNTGSRGNGGVGGAGGAFGGRGEDGQDGEDGRTSFLGDSPGNGGLGGDGGGGAGLGGAVFVNAGTLTVGENVLFQNNSAIGGSCFKSAGLIKGGRRFRPQPLGNPPNALAPLSHNQKQKGAAFLMMFKEPLTSALIRG